MPIRLQVVTFSALLITNFAFANRPIDKIKKNLSLEVINSGEIGDLNIVDANGNAAIHIATILDRADVIEWLALKGANLVLSNRYGMSPIELAIRLERKYSLSALILLVPNPYESVGLAIGSFFGLVPNHLRETIVEAYRDKSAAVQLMKYAAYEAMLSLRAIGMPHEVCRKVAFEVLQSSNVPEYLPQVMIERRKLDLVRRWLKLGFELDAKDSTWSKVIEFRKTSKEIQSLFHQRIQHDLPRGDEPDESDVINIVSFLNWRLSRLRL